MNTMPVDAPNTVALLRELVASALGNEVRLILSGASSHNDLDDESSECYPAGYADYDGKGFHFMTYVQAHLESTATGRSPAYPEEFERWLADGAPGINLAQVLALKARSPSAL
ncbi:hypothetical protein [Caldimonas brevitalea]|uniref:hypothetical protein n=1 Tax=Caldimonas brevitalea TaxID=413882 RepID=UPI0012FB3A21|nr:hypothetical protein [Caldimonas brevitalea]